MGTLNPDLLHIDMDVIMNDAVDLRAEFNHTAIQPELILLALIRRPNTAAARLLGIQLLEDDFFRENSQRSASRVFDHLLRHKIPSA